MTVDRGRGPSALLCTLFHARHWKQEDDEDLLVFWKSCTRCGRSWSAAPVPLWVHEGVVYLLVAIAAGLMLLAFALAWHAVQAADRAECGYDPALERCLWRAPR